LKRIRFAVLLAISLTLVFFSARAHGQQPGASKPADTLILERVGDTAFVLLRAPSFQTLTPRQQALAYWLTQASIAIDPIIYDQLSAYGLRQKRLLEEIMAHSAGINPLTRTKIAAFTKLFWANRGNHNEITSQKFLPGFTPEELWLAASSAQHNGAFQTAYADLPPLQTPADVRHELDDLRAPLFDLTFETMTTAKSPTGGKDVIQASSNTFYPSLSLADLRGFEEKYPLNSRVIRDPHGKLSEMVYRAGTPDGKVPPGLYATFLEKANEYLKKAQAYADPQQAEAIGHLIGYYETGERTDWTAFEIAWVQNDAAVDFANGFIDASRDARAAKGSAQSFVSVTDKPETNAFTKLAENAAYFEQKAPWLDKYKRESFRLPVVKAVETVIETGDFPVLVVGANFPDENDIREKYGSKNFLYTGASRAFAAATGKVTFAEFAADEGATERNRKYGTEAERLLAALHEVIGHGSGKLSERLSKGAEPLLKEYLGALEEARADLMALWNSWDSKLKELGLVSN